MTTPEVALSSPMVSGIGRTAKWLMTVLGIAATVAVMWWIDRNADFAPQKVANVLGCGFDTERFLSSTNQDCNGSFVESPVSLLEIHLVEFDNVTFFLHAL